MLSFLKNYSISMKQCYKLTLVMCLSFVAVIFPEVLNAAATGNSEIGNTLCRVVNAMTGTVGKAVSSIAVFFLGLGLFMGKVSWSVALAVAIGIGIIFGAPLIIDQLSGESAKNC